MIFNRHIQATMVVLFCGWSCAPKISYQFITAENSNIRKVYFGQDKDVIESNAFGQHGTFFLHHDFSFKKRFAVSLGEVKVVYRGPGMHLTFFIGKHIKKILCRLMDMKTS